MSKVCWSLYGLSTKKSAMAKVKARDNIAIVKFNSAQPWSIEYGMVHMDEHGHVIRMLVLGVAIIYQLGSKHMILTWGGADFVPSFPIWTMQGFVTPHPE